MDRVASSRFQAGCTRCLFSRRSIRALIPAKFAKDRPASAPYASRCARACADRPLRRRGMRIQNLGGLPAARRGASLALAWRTSLSGEARRIRARPSPSPLAHAAEKSLSSSGTGSPCSTRSARIRRAIASVFATASSRLDPYDKDPGKALISAIKRPSASRSISTFNMDRRSSGSRKNGSTPAHCRQIEAPKHKWL